MQGDTDVVVILVIALVIVAAIIWVATAKLKERLYGHSRKSKEELEAKLDAELDAELDEEFQTSVGDKEGETFYAYQEVQPSKQCVHCGCENNIKAVNCEVCGQAL